MLTKEQRIAISKKIASVPGDNAKIDSSINIISAKLSSVQSQDDANKSLIADKDLLINPYQNEISRYDSNLRTTITEDDYLNSANKVVGNSPFFPNSTTLKPASIPDGIWKSIIPFSQSYAIGKNYVEGWTVIRSEKDIIHDIRNKIDFSINNFLSIENTTGMTCNSGGNCSIGGYTSSMECSLHGGSWSSYEEISNNNTIQGNLSELTLLMTELKNYISATKQIILLNPDLANQTELDTSSNNAQSLISYIDSWLSLPNFDSNHHQSNCMGFNSMNPLVLSKTKMRGDTITEIISNLNSRDLFTTSRKSQVESHLGSISQDLSNGSIISMSGLYGSRFRLIMLRLSCIGGTLSSITSMNNAKKAQEQTKDLNSNALISYSEVLNCKRFISPAAGHEKVSLVDTSGFSVGNACFIVSDTQEEMSGTILAINGNVITLSFKIPSKYRESDFARIYSYT